MKFLLFLWLALLGPGHKAPGQKSNPSPQNQNLERPKLVVGIVVDQMRYDFLYRYYSKYGNGGFKRLLREGYSFANCQYTYFPTKTAAGHASIYTGTTPAVHGIVGNDWYEPAYRRMMHCVRDDSVTAIGGSGKHGNVSPKNMITWTVADQLKLATNFKAKTYSVSLKDRGAILPGGHAADAAFWLDRTSGQFISSTYYRKLEGKLPAWLQEFNARKLADQYRNSVWNTLLPLEQYTESTTDLQPWEASLIKGHPPVFPYDLKQYDGGDYEIVKQTPFGNTLTTDLAQALLQHEKLGKGPETDMLMISYSSTDEVGHEYGAFAIETEDTYLRLDRDLERLFRYLDEQTGKGQYLVFLTADHGIVEVPAFLKEHDLPSGLFHYREFQKKLGDFSEATFQVNLLERYENQQIYINDSLLRARNLNREDVLKAFIAFTEKQPRVCRAFAFSGSRPYPAVPFLEKYEAGYFPGRSGDIQVVLHPGILERTSPKGTNHTTANRYDSHVPCLWMGWKIRHGESTGLMGVEDIAPTLSTLLHILEPNGSTGNPQPIPLRP